MVYLSLFSRCVCVTSCPSCQYVTNTALNDHRHRRHFCYSFCTAVHDRKWQCQEGSSEVKEATCDCAEQHCHFTQVGFEQGTAVSGLVAGTDK